MAQSSEEDINFIKNELLPELVHDRCFCEPSSREFVEFDSATVEPESKQFLTRTNKVISCSYSANVTVQFSGEPKSFPIIIKLSQNSTEFDGTFEFFKNEDFFYSKIVKKYNKSLFPKCYVSNLGKYGRPVIVVEDLTKSGYEQINRQLNEDELKLCLNKIGQFHGTGLKLKRDEPDIFNEFRVNLFMEQLEKCDKQLYNKHILCQLKEHHFDDIVSKVEKKLGNDPVEGLIAYNSRSHEKLHTICHGNLTNQNFLFKYENEKVIDIKLTNFETLTVSSIGLCVATILLRNVRKKNTIQESMQKYCSSYDEGLKKLYSNILLEDLTSDIIESHLYGYIYMYMPESVVSKSNT